MMENGALFQENSRSTKARIFLKVEIALYKFVSYYPVLAKISKIWGSSINDNISTTKAT